MGSGGTPPSGVGRFYGGGVPWVSITDMTRAGKFVAATERTLSPEGLMASSAKLYADGAVLYAMYASIGECSIAVGRVSSSQAILGIEPGPKLDRDFLYYRLSAMKPWVQTLGQQGTQSNLNAGMVRKFPLPLPSLGEQRAIARALSDADEMCVALRRLIGKKREIRLGIEQTLFAEQANWADSELGKLFSFKNGLNKAKAFFGHGTPIVNYMDVLRHSGLRRVNIGGLVSVSSDERRAYSARPGDIFFTRTSETVEEIGFSSILLEEVPGAVFSGFVLRARPTSAAIKPEFARYYLRLEPVRRQIIATASFTTRALTNGRSLSQVRVRIPPVEVQERIALVLDECEKEVGSLEARLAKLEDVKKGMAQALLSGQRRLARWRLAA